MGREGDEKYSRRQRRKRNIQATKGEIGEGKEKSTPQEKKSSKSRNGDGKRWGREIHVKVYASLFEASKAYLGTRLRCFRLEGASFLCFKHFLQCRKAILACLASRRALLAPLKTLVMTIKIPCICFVLLLLSIKKKTI